MSLDPSLAQTGGRDVALSQYAQSRSWRHDLSAPHLVGRWKGTPFRHADRVGPSIGPEDSRHVLNLMSGDFQGMQAAAFDYACLPGYGKDEPVVQVDSALLSALHIAKTLVQRRRLDSLVPQFYGVVMLSLPGTLPGIEVAHQGFLAKSEKLLGAPDTDFEVEDFNRRWRIESDIAKTGHDVIHPRLMEFLLAGPAWSFRIEGSDIWTWAPGFYEPDQAHSVIQPRLEWLHAIVSHIPDFVWREHPLATPAPSPPSGTAWFPDGEPSR